MSNSKVLTVFLVSFLFFIGGMGQDRKDDEGTYLFGLPFLQLTNGGVRVKFGGYHAEAGLGGLLGGSRTGGGLHASAGTPWGAHAGAGLGGLLGGNDATAGGGLYARAGLGPGMPEAAAGLGGLLDGSGRSAAPAAGGLYAGATLGDDVLRFGDTGLSASSDSKVQTSTGIDSGSFPTTVSGTTKPRGRTNIQIVTRSRKSARAKQDPADVKISSKSIKEVRRDISISPVSAQASLVGAVLVDRSEAPQNPDEFKIKVKIDQGQTAEATPPEPSEVSKETTKIEEKSASPATDGVAEYDATTKVTSKSDKLRLRFRRLLLSKMPKRRVVPETASSEINDFKPRISERVTRQATQADAPSPQTSNPDEPTPEYQTKKDNTFLDDVFNIPQATLTAVKGVAKNTSGQ